MCVCVCVCVCVLRGLMATGRTHMEIISMQAVFESRASMLKTTSGSHDWVIERVIMLSREIRPAEGALSSRWGRDFVPRCLWDRVRQRSTRQLGKLGVEQREVRSGAL